MKREILFRGKRVDNGEWVEGGFTLDAIDFPRITVKDGDGLIFHKVIAETVGQFTGLLDKNGKKIFEGDIIDVHEDVCSEIKTWRNQVCFKNAVFALYDPDCCEICKNGFGITCSLSEAHCMWDIEIVGNIHDNPELLKQ